MCRCSTRLRHRHPDPDPTNGRDKRFVPKSCAAGVCRWQVDGMLWRTHLTTRRGPDIRWQNDGMLGMTRRRPDGRWWSGNRMFGMRQRPGPRPDARRWPTRRYGMSGKAFVAASPNARGIAAGRHGDWRNQCQKRNGWGTHYKLLLLGVEVLLLTYLMSAINPHIEPPIMAAATMMYPARAR